MKDIDMKEINGKLEKLKEIRNKYYNDITTNEMENIYKTNINNIINLIEKNINENNIHIVKKELNNLLDSIIETY